MIGEIQLFAGETPPEGWSFCDGSTVLNNMALCVITGIQYSEDGSFQIPNLAPVITGDKSAQVKYIICTRGIFPSEGSFGGVGTIGEIRAFAGRFAPGQWMHCNGSNLEVTKNPALFSVLQRRFCKEKLYNSISKKIEEDRFPSQFQIPHLAPITESDGGESPIHYIICVNGIYPFPEWQSDDEAIVGQIRLFAGESIPGGWMSCDGNKLSAEQYSKLFDVIGYRFGGGNGEFHIPSLEPVKECGDGVIDSKDFRGIVRYMICVESA
jgi:microcystin-dependent protein